jgi:hypothetical protein
MALGSRFSRARFERAFRGFLGVRERYHPNVEDEKDKKGGDILVLTLDEAY